jgi:para-aminobenzoate synthetase/4-amino-4-deoxychorismate lyase
MNRWHSPPAELYALVEHAPATVLLESAEPPAAEPGRDTFSRLFTAPLRVHVANDSADIPEIFAEIKSAIEAGYYAAGYFAYECGSCFEPKAAIHPSRPGQPLAWIGIYNRCHLFDHRTGAFVDGNPPGLADCRAKAVEQPFPAAPPFDAHFSLTEQQFAERIDAIHEWIRSGDVYQLNFTAPIRVHAPGSPADLYQRLRHRQPAPYGAFLHTQPDRRILSFSPELFFRLDACQLDETGLIRRIVTRPMKGTAPRGRTTREDRDQAEWLHNDPKNRAENVMIVDLLRNDLGRLCEYGTVRAEDLFAVERYPTLWQMTSTVTGELRPEVGFHQIFRALFPCGSITGAPKVRAMQLLAEIEPQPRGVYTGAIGFFSKEQTVFNVAIRTLELDGDCGTMGVGSGIVIDSNPAEEFRECLMKAEFLTRAPSTFPEHLSLVETLLWNGEYPFVELHLDRLEDSADYFDFPCDRAATKAALFAHSAAFPDCIPQKVRLLLNRGGELHIKNEILSGFDNPKPARIRIAAQRTDPQDPMLFHKTSHRPIYARAFKDAIDAGFDDVLFLNLRGEVTEGAIHNVFIEKDGRWFTPPIQCGLLAGVQRRHLLETRPSAAERVLHLDDLREADAVYLCNAVRGLRPACIYWNTVLPGV